ncbi:hypothetical protein TWF696_008602 [Orbilia brochopaga]|uniref:Uncharacterized protein n=1 Tax=Orbilia brochopaga TaxID=3140254 RepID=A0AAV9UHL6_9PEZI
MKSTSAAALVHLICFISLCSAIPAPAYWAIRVAPSEIPGGNSSSEYTVECKRPGDSNPQTKDEWKACMIATYGEPKPGDPLPYIPANTPHDVGWECRGRWDHGPQSPEEKQRCQDKFATSDWGTIYVGEDSFPANGPPDTYQCVTFLKFRQESLLGSTYDNPDATFDNPIAVKQPVPHWDELKRLQKRIADEPSDTPFWIIENRRCRRVYCHSEIGVGVTMCNVADAAQLSVSASFVALALDGFIRKARKGCAVLVPPAEATGFRRETWALAWDTTATVQYGITIEPCNKDEDFQDIRNKDGPLYVIGYY